MCVLCCGCDSFTVYKSDDVSSLNGQIEGLMFTYYHVDRYLIQA